MVSQPAYVKRIDDLMHEQGRLHTLVCFEALALCLLRAVNRRGAGTPCH